MPMNDTRVRPLRKRVAADDDACDELRQFDPILRRVYSTRGVTKSEQLDYTLPRLAPVRTLSGIDAAVDLVVKHRDNRVIIIGDFDADGATSTALVIRCLREFGWKDVDYLVPNRFEYGYGLSPEIVRVAAARSPDLLITVDNGVSSIEGVNEAKRLGMQVLITDHHLPGAELPTPDAMLNPNLEGSEFASPYLAGIGVAFYLMAALGRALEAEGRSGAARVPARYLDLVALGTVADVVTLDHNNRILVQQGLQRIRAGKTVAGIRELFLVAGRSPARAVSSDLGFVVAPRLNAAGRLEDMSLGIECLLTDDAGTAAKFAARLDEINKQRRVIEADMRREAFSYVDAIDSRELPACVCLYDEKWHPGIVGLIASRVRERCDRPVIAFAQEGEGILKGSARSVSGVHVRDLLEAVSTVKPSLIVKFGGHAMAAGLNIEERNLDEFSAVAAQQLGRLYPDADFSGAILTDGDLPADTMNLDFAKLLREAGPWGAGFPEPVFTGQFEIDEQRTVGEKHLKLRVRPTAGGSGVDAIAFNQAGPAYRGVVQLTYRLDVNEYRGFESPQLVVEQIVNIAS
jgi:single-stranded-DNA-specific exonuclease